MKTADSLLSLDMTAMLLSDLNKELHFKISENHPVAPDAVFLTMWSDGTVHKIFFMDQLIYSTEAEKIYENMPLRVEIEMNERDNFEKHLRLLINNQVSIYKDIDV